MTFIAKADLVTSYMEVFLILRSFDYMKGKDREAREAAVSKLKKNLDEWLVIIKKTNSQELGAFVDTNASDLIFIKDSILSRGLRSHHDRIFVKYLKMSKRPPIKTTKLFEEFVRGITYFQSQNPDFKTPIYHRILSCGMGTLKFRNEFNRCTIPMESEKRADVEKRIETCYIERLIYDKIYRHIEFFLPGEDRSQDKGHLNWLDVTKGDFATCFPNVDLRVKVKYKTFLSISQPVQLRIKRYYKKRLVSTVTFTKKANIDFMGKITYDRFVDCVKSTRESSWFKVQTFENEHFEWRALDLAP